MLGASGVWGREEQVRRFARVLRAARLQCRGGFARSRSSSLRGGGSNPPRRRCVLPFLGQRHSLSDPTRDLPDHPRARDDRRPGPRASDCARAVPGKGTRLVLDLLPFGVAAIRVGSPQVQLGQVTPYPSEAVLADMQRRDDDLSSQLSRLNQGPTRGFGPANPGFEPSAAPLVQLTTAHVPALPRGWLPIVGGASTVEVHRRIPTRAGAAFGSMPSPHRRPWSARRLRRRATRP